jgi:patched 1 protein
MCISTSFLHLFPNTGLQKAFDRDWSRGSITQERWFPNASHEGILAYKLLVQTGHVDNPIDKSLVTQVTVQQSIM